MNIKKFALVASAVALAGVAQASDISWSWWMENPANTDVSFGFATQCASVRTFELTALYSESKVTEGMQCSFFGINNAKDSNCALQFSWWFNNGGDPCVQLGCLNFNEKSCFDFGFINVSKKTSVQIGLLNFNKEGFLPVFPFINIDKSVFK